MYTIYFRKQSTPTLSKYDYKTDGIPHDVHSTIIATIPSTEINSAGIYYVGLLAKENSTSGKNKIIYVNMFV